MKNGYIWENKQETIAGVIKLISYNLAIKFDQKLIRGWNV